MIVATPRKWWIGAWLAIALYVAGGAVPVTFWIDVHQIEVDGAATPEAVIVRSDRTIYQPFPGDFTVEIRRSDGWHICTSTYDGDAAIPYKRRERGDKLWTEGVSLAWWIGGDRQLAKCKNSGLTDGWFYLITCHTVVEPFERIIGFLPFRLYGPRTQCWTRTDVFQIGGAA